VAHLLDREGVPAAPALLCVAVFFALGVWVCDVTGRHLGIADHGAMVWDEVVAFLLVLVVIPDRLEWQAAAFVLFRFFDIAKPPPIRWLEARFKGGFGVMVDDLLAAATRSSFSPRRKGFSVNALASRVGRRLKAKRARLVTAESCTGGWDLAGRDCGQRLLRLVRARLRHLLECRQAGNARREEEDSGEARCSQRGDGARDGERRAVEEPWHDRGGRHRRRRSDGRSAAKPVGMVCFAWATRRGLWSETRRFRGNRASVRRQSVARALKGVLERG